MFEERTEEAVFLSYGDYLDSGGLFTEEDYGIISSLADEKSSSPASAKAAQITGIAAFCKIQVTQKEIIIYKILSRKIPPQKGLQKPEDPRTIPVWKMSDQELIRQILLATEGNGKGSKYQILTVNTPTFSNS